MAKRLVLLVVLLAGVAVILLVTQISEERLEPTRPEALSELRVPRSPGARPILWVLAIGVGDYREADLDLRYAASDAQSVVEVLRRQAQGPLYERVETKLLTDASVTRASILTALDEFVGQAAPIDVGVVYLAGHGVRDPVRDTFYFLPPTASAGRPHIEGLEVAELNRQLHLVHRNLRRLLVIVDTCQSGSVARETGVELGQDIAARLAPAEGLYVLAAASSGEVSMELESLRHGLFTHALLDGLDGAAANPDGLVTVFGLAEYTTRIVRQLSEGRQHPYQAILGADLVLAADPRQYSRITPPALPTPIVASAPTVRERVAVLRFENLRPDPDQSWMEKALRQEFTTALASVSRLDVYEEPEVRFLARGVEDADEAVQRAGMQKVVSGSYWIENDHITITANVKNVSPVQRVASARIDGRLDDFFALRGKIVLQLLGQLRIDLPPDELERVRQPETTDLAARKLLQAAEGDAVDEQEPTPTPAARGRSSAASFLNRALSSIQILSPPCYATENAFETEVHEVLEEYRAAFVREDLEALSRFYVKFSEGQRRSLQQYFDNAEALEVELDDVRVAIIGDRASVSFTRRDRFIDRETGQSQRLVVRQTKLFERGPEGWQIVPED